MKIQYKIYTNNQCYMGESELECKDLRRTYDRNKNRFILSGPDSFYCESETKDDIKQIMEILKGLEQRKYFQYYAWGLCAITTLTYPHMLEDDETCDPESAGLSCK